MGNRDERLYIDGILGRCEKLIRQRVWAGVDQARLGSWFVQFADRDAQLLGACLLDQLIFRSRDQVDAMLRSLVTCSEVQKAIGTSHYDNELVERLSPRRPDPRIRLSPVISLDQAPTKSGPYILRRLQKSLGLNPKWMIWPQSIVKEAAVFDTLFLVDDFCGSGQQFRDFLSANALDLWMESSPSHKIVYLTLAAHSKGKHFIEANYPAVRLIAAETLSDDHSFFSGSFFRELPDDAIRSKLSSDYQKISTWCGLGGGVGRFGHESMGLTYAFEHGTPNNSLPIYWFDNEKWMSLLDR